LANASGLRIAPSTLLRPDPCACNLELWRLVPAGGVVAILAAENGPWEARGESPGRNNFVADGRRQRMGLIRTILALVVLLILVHVGLMYTNVEQGTNVLTSAVYSLGVLVESPARLLLNTVTPLQEYLNPRSDYVVALTAAAVYFILYLLLGVGRRN
jgi:hypothetical protein